MAELEGVIMKQKIRMTGLAYISLILEYQWVLEEFPEVSYALPSIDSSIVIVGSDYSFLIQE